MPFNPAPGTTGIERFGSGVARSIPYYNALGTVWHLLEGTLGQHGPAPSVIGRITQTLFPKIGQPQPAVQTPGQPAAPAPATSTSGTGDPNAPAQQRNDPSAYLNARNSIMQQILRNPTLYNSFRPAFAPTWQQLVNPGSAIGPMNATSNPYDPNMRTRPSMDTSIPGFAGAFIGNELSRNQV